MWRSHLQDVGILYSLVDDLQLFWQYKALEWEKLARKVAQAIEEENRSGNPKPISVEERLEQILNHNEDYRPLKERIVLELEEATVIADFLHYSKVEALKSLHFTPPLPDNSVLEAAITEAETLSKWVKMAPYWWHNCLFMVRKLFSYEFRRNSNS